MINAAIVRPISKNPTFGAVTDSHGAFLVVVPARGESDEATIKREVLEETGLVVTSSRFVFALDVAIAHTSVFEVKATGNLGSWEGEPAWVGLPELTANIFANHVPVLDFVRKSIEQYEKIAIAKLKSRSR